MSTSNSPDTDSGDYKALEVALSELQATAAQFAATCISDSRARTRYAQDIAAASKGRDAPFHILLRNMRRYGTASLSERYLNSNKPASMRTSFARRGGQIKTS